MTITSGLDTDEYIDSLTLISILHQTKEKTITEFVEYKYDTLRYSYKEHTTNSYFYYDYEGRLSEIQTRNSKKLGFPFKSIFILQWATLYIITRIRISWEPQDWGEMSYVNVFLPESSII